MNLFQNFFITALFYLLFLYSTVVSRISDKRKCADADCSEPVSLATTLVRYNADDDRLLSFPPNVKLKVFSKEAGKNPTFWEVEINGKRGYVPKDFLREDRVLIPKSKLTHIVPTGKTDSPKLNATLENQKEPESVSKNLLSATPELPVANSKGLFSTIGGVSADSVPMNSPDIKPQSTRKFQVFGGTTVYDDVVSEKPESPPTSIETTANGNQESDKKPPDSNVPSSDIKPVNEEVDENKQAIGTEQKNEEVVKLSEKEEDLRKEGNQPSEDAVEAQSDTNLLGNFLNSMSNFISSGAGEDVTEEELEEEDGDDEGSVDDEDYEDEEEESRTENKVEETTGKEPGKLSQSKGLPSEKSHTNTSEAPNWINILDESSTGLKPDDALKSEENQEELPDKNTDVENIEKVTEESMKSSSGIKTNANEQIKLDERDNPPSVSVEKEDTLSESVKVDKLKSELTQGSHLLKEEIIQQPEGETSPSGSDNIYEQSSQQVTIQDPKKITDEVKTEGKAGENESTIEPTKDQSDEAPEYQAKSDSKEPQVKVKIDEMQGQEHHKTDKPHDQEQPKIDESPVQGEPSSDTLQVQEQPKSDEPHVEKQPKTDKPQINEQPTIDESQVQEQPKTVESQVQEHPEITTHSPTLQPPSRQFLFGSGQLKGGIPDEKRNETSETSPEPHDDMSPEAENVNDTAQVNLPPSDVTSSSFLTTHSPKYASVVSRRIQGSESSPANEILTHTEVEEDSETQPYNTVDTSGSTPIHEETLSPNLLLHSQSPKYSAVVSNRIGSVTPSENVKSEMAEAATKTQTVHPDLADVSTTEEKFHDVSTVEAESQGGMRPIEDIESEEEIDVESNEVPLQDSQPSIPPDDVSPEVGDQEIPVEEEGMFSWATSFFDTFGSKDSSSNEEPPAISENVDPLRMSKFEEETCSADGVEGSCPPVRDSMQKEVTWQEASYTSDMWELLDRVPLEATVWLIITAVVILIFSLGHYYIEAHRRDGPLVAIINKLEREVLILKKERCIMEDRLHIAEQQLEVWNTSSSENDALLMELKQELEETKAAKAELEEQAAQLKEELETVTESGLEMHRLLEESLSSQDGSQVLLSTVETLREKLQRQEEEISGLSDTLSSKNAEVEELQGRLVHSAEVARSLEDKVISVTREKEDELLQLRDKHRELISQLEEVMETKALEETRLSTEMSKLRLNIEELQKTLAEKDSELDTLKEVVKQLRFTDSNEKIEALFDVVSVRAKLKTAVAERDDFREKFLEEEGARKLLEGHMKKITQEVAELKNSFETAEKEKIEALTKLQVLSNYFKEKESQLQKELGLQESMWLQKQSDDHTIYEQMRSLREENEKYKLQNESLKKEIVEQEASFKIQLANTEQKAHENWVASRQAERRLKEAQQESAQLRNRLTTVEKNSGNYSLDEKPNISESNGDPSSPPPSLIFPPTTSPPFMMYGPPIPPPGDFVPPPPLMGSPYPSDSRPPPLGRISSPPLDHRFSPPPPLPYPPYDYSSYRHSPSPPPPFPPLHRNVHKPQPREMSREQKDHVPNYSQEGEKTSRRNKR